MDITIIGAGIVGIATAYKLQIKYPNANIAILEKENDHSKHQSGNNSGVIHSGIYYPPNSLKAKNCLNGYKQLLDFADDHKIKYKLIGKLIVAYNSNQFDFLYKIYDYGKKNSLSGISYLDEKQMNQIEPNVKGIKAIYVPQAGIIDYKEVANKILKIFTSRNGKIYYNQEVTNIKESTSEVIIQTKDNTFKSDFLINCAGLYSDKIAAIQGQELNYRIIPFRGEYYSLNKNLSNHIQHLIYPVPDPDFPFLGVHLTPKLNGDLDAGPNAVLAFAKEGYSINDFNLTELYNILTYSGFIKLASKYWKKGLEEMKQSFSKKTFHAQLSKIVEGVELSDLINSHAGVRAQACDKNGNLIDDFLILKSNYILNVCNAPSPAATSSLSIADYIVENINLN